MKKQLPPALNQTCLELAVELTRGPQFFDDSGHPTEAVLRYTGDRVMQDDERCLMAGALRLLECSDRQIAAALGCDTRSIPLMLRAAEKSGRIPALKDRLTQWTGTNAERAQIALGQLLDRASEGKGDVDLASMIKAVATTAGILTQNLQLLTGGPTEILELKVGAGRQEIEDWARRMAVPIEATVSKPTDLESTAGPSKHLQTQGASNAGHGQDTATPGPTDVARGAGGVSLDGGAAGGDGSNGS